MKMFSYLDNLVARQLPETAVIQPRPISLFEPWPGTASISPPPAIGEEETAVSSPSIHPLPRPQTPRIPSPTVPAAPQPALPTLTPPAPQPASPSPLPPTPTLRPASSEPAPPPQKQPPVNDAPAAIQPSPPRQPVLAPPAPVNVTPTSLHHRAEPPPAKETHPPVIIREQITRLKQVVESPAPSIPPLVETVREQPIQPSPPVKAAIRPEQIKPFIPANGRPSNHQPPVTPPPEPAPTIQITIGRIEVRATPPPPAKVEQKQPRTPVLSLDDYLRQRNGGRP